MTDEQKWLARRYLIYRLFTNLWFVGAVWLYFYRLFINDQQVGFLDGMSFAIGLLAEVPSGALADKFGRHRIVRLGQILTGTGFLIQAAGHSFMPLFFGQAVLMIGASFASGADEALFFQRLNFKRDSVEWRKLVTRASQVGLVGSLFAYTAGSLLHGMHPRLPWIMNGVAFLIASLLVWRVKDGRPRSEREKFSTELISYLTDIKAGFKEFTTQRLWLYVPIIVIVQGLFYTAGWGLLRLVLLDRFDFSPFFGAVVISLSSLITVGVLAILHKYANRLSERRVITAISLAAAAALLLAMADIGVWGFVVLLALYAGEHVLYPFMSEVLNLHAPEQQRATVLSVASFLRMLPYIVLAPLIGFLNTNGNLEVFLFGWAALMGIAVLLYLSIKKRDERIQVREL